MQKERRNLLITGSVVGAVAVFLTVMGNPANMGFCIACFLRDMAGSLHLQNAAAVMYMRPEILGIVLGAFIVSLCFGEFSPRGGSSPVLRFMIGFFVMVGALVFLGCPLRMVLRLAGGDLNAVVGLLGFIAGVGVGCLFLNKGFSLGRTEHQMMVEGVAFPALQMVLLFLLLAIPTVLNFSKEGPGSQHAPAVLALAAGLAVGILAQRSRLCMAGGVRDLFLFKDSTLITGPLFIFIVALIGNLITGKFHVSFAGQPVAHTAWLWNFLGMTVVGLGSVMLGGCPLRQLVLAGEGNSDSVMAVLGMVAGGAFAHNFALASSGKGPTSGGKIATIIALIFFVAVAWIISRRKQHAEG